MPTPETAAAFEKLVEARARLNEVTKQLNEAHAQIPTGMDARQRHSELQLAWREAFAEFETATDELAALVHRLKQELNHSTL